MGQVPDSAALSLADHVERDASLAHCLAVAQEVHTMTSLVGFEGCCAGLAVATYGQPFYSGWASPAIDMRCREGA